MNYQDKLQVELGESTLNFDISFGYLDRSYDVFNFETKKSESVSGYLLSLNPDYLDAKSYRALEKMMNNEKTLHNVFICLDGIIKKGKAKIAQKFGINGLNLDVELHEI